MTLCHRMGSAFIFRLKQTNSPGLLDTEDGLQPSKCWHLHTQ